MLHIIKVQHVVICPEVVKNVASPPDIERARSLLWEFLEENG